MTEQEWKQLEEDGEENGHLLEMTMQETEHPEWYNGPCFCWLCSSYAGV